MKKETEYKKELHDFDYKYTGRVFTAQEQVSIISLTELVKV